MTPEILVRIELPEEGLELLRRDFTVHYAPTTAELEAALAELGGRVRGVVTNGTIGLTGAQMRAMPRLEIITTRGVGYERVDTVTAVDMGVIITSGKGTNAASVADHAIGLMLAVARGIVTGDRRARERAWAQSRAPRPTIAGKRLGILGLGEIGREVARRGADGFGMQVSYHNRRQRDDVDYTYRATPLALAAEADFVVVCMPGGAETRGMVGRDFLEALGPQGFLVNVGRGSVVDTAALVDALNEGRIAGAGLDVVDGEPDIPEALLRAPNTVLTPHIASRSPESVTAAMHRIADNMKAHFTGRPLVSRTL